ncbi:MAG: substrate-binding domain-containing protein, partial [Bacillota bacterium]
MKRIIYFLVISFMVFSLLAGGSAVRAKEEMTIGVSIPAATHGWTGGVNYWAETTIDRLDEEYENIEFILSTAEGPEEQINDLDDLYAVHQIDALVILPFESDPLTDPVRHIKEQDVFVTVVDRGLAEEGIEDIYVAGNNPEMGRVSAEYMIDKLNGEGEIVVLRGIPSTIDNQRFDAFMELVEETDIEVLDWEYAHWNRD